MAEALSIIEHRQGAARFADEAVCLLLGAALTLGIFVCVAHFEIATPAAPKSDIEDLRVLSAFAEPPPPKVDPRPEEASLSPPLTGLEIGPSDSPVKLAVVPPDLDKIIPPSDAPPPANIQFNQLLTDLRPRTGGLGDLQHIYQQNEVDQVPIAVVKTIAHVSNRTREDAPSLRATLLVVIDAEGAVTDIRVMKPSGNADFDNIVLKCVRDEWVFTPAIRKGRKVRCMVQQLIWYKWTEGSKFTI